MRILLTNSIFYPNAIGGAESVSYWLARELSARGHVVNILATTGTCRDSEARATGSNGLKTRELADINGRIFEARSGGLYDLLPADEGRRPHPNLLVRGAHHFLALRSARWNRLTRQILEDTRSDVIHTHNIVGMTPSVWRAARDLGVPVVHTLHDYHLLCPRTTLLRSTGVSCDRAPLPCGLLARSKLAATRDVSVVTAPSRFVLERHLLQGGFPHARASVVPNPLVTECSLDKTDDSIPDERDSPLSVVRGLFLGQLEKHKGVPQLLAALGSLFTDDSSRLPQSFYFSFAGTGSLVGEVEEFCRRHAKRCRYHGVVLREEKERLLATSTLLVLPSLWHENFPIAILEAFGNGLPVISTRRGGIPELVEHETNGLLVEPRPDALATAILRYATDGRERLLHGAAGRATAHRFSIRRCVDSFLDLYGAVFNQHALKASPMENTLNVSSDTSIM